MKKSNPQVPDSTIIKHLSIENGKLKSEIAYLEDKLKRQEHAIKDFKVWQSKVCERNYDYWLSVAKDYVSKGYAIDEEECNDLLSFFEPYERYSTKLNALKRERDRVIERYRLIHKRFAPTSDDVHNPLV